MTGPALQVTFLTTRIEVKPEGTGPKNVRLKLVTNPEVAISAAISPALHPWHPSVSSDLLAVRFVQPRADIWNAPKMTITFRDTQNTAPMTWSDPSVIESQRCSKQVASWDRLENGDHAEHGKPVRPYRYSTATATSSWKEPSIGDNALHRPLRPAIHVALSERGHQITEDAALDVPTKIAALYTNRMTDVPPEQKIA